MKKFTFGFCPQAEMSTIKDKPLVPKTVDIMLSNESTPPSNFFQPKEKKIVSTSNVSLRQQ